MIYMGKGKKVKELSELQRSIKHSEGRDLEIGEEVLAGTGVHSIGVEGG